MNAERTTLDQRVKQQRWLVPLVFGFLTIFALIAPPWDLSIKVSAEIILFGVISSLVVFWNLNLILQWHEDQTYVELAYHNAAHQLGSMVQSAATSIITLNSEGTIQTWNAGAEQLFGQLAEIMIGKPFSVLLGGGHAAKVEAAWLLDTIRREGFIDQHETMCYQNDGHRIAVTLTATDMSGTMRDIFIVIHDITRRKRLEEETRRLNVRLKEQATAQTYELAEKVEQLAHANADLRQLDQTRSEFVSVVSHQIRAPLTNMVGAIQRMQTDCRSVNTTCSRMFYIFEQQVNRLDHLVQDVLNASRIEAGQISFLIEPSSILSVIRQAIQQAQVRTPTRQIHLTDKPGLPLVYADRDRVVEILSNLLDNADKYSPPGEDIYIEARADQSTVTVSVRDGGDGLPVQDQERMFDKFYRADSSDSQRAYGYGLGLYICRRLVEAQHGHIWAENHPDGGAVFSFSLPVWQE